MYLTFTMKSIVLIIAFATQYVYAKSRNGYAYFDEKFCVLEWIIYLKRLSLIALILCGIVLYYVPKSRSYVQRTCCILIDSVANGLKFALNTNGIEYEKVKTRDENDQNEELRIQELYRKVYEEDTRDYGQKYSKTNFDNDNHKSISNRKHKSKKYRIKHNDRKHYRYNRHRNAANDILPESDIMILSTINSPQQTTIIDEKYETDNVVIPLNTSSETKITKHVLGDKLKNNTNLREENSWNKKTDSNTISEIDKNDTTYKLIHENNSYQEISYIVNNNSHCVYGKFTADQKHEDVSTQMDIDTDKKLQNKQNFNYMKHEKVIIASQHELSKDYTTRVMNKKMDPLYEKSCTKRELRSEFRKENDPFHHEMKSFIHKNSPITKDRVKPVLQRVVNWLFGGCPETSKRHREQVDKVGKEEIFKSTNMWFSENELYLQQ